MKRFVYFDSGTTNSRAYLIEDGTLADEVRGSVGTITNVMNGSNDVLPQELFKLYEVLLHRNELTDADVHGIYMSGMATSKNGVKEIGYLRLPLSPESYAVSASYAEVPAFGREVGFLTGIVYRPDEPGCLDNIELFHNARGEEIELFGIMEKKPELFSGKNCAVIMPGTHTHILFTKDRTITSMCSSIGGELFQAAREHTILKASVPVIPEGLDEEGKRALIKGYHAVQELGFNRALYMVRTFDLFSEENDNVRGCFMEGVVNADILQGIVNYRKEHALDQVIIAGQEIYAEIFGTMLSEAFPELPFFAVYPGGESFALSGFMNLVPHLK
ncbi:MAG: 2-dehydro-3-deoxygalactonokinase [Lachnospiraceae bacterium]|nr:2-dehydro-3-deoxygalactonokinase [Lachnospiraceae bacterium]